jgi:hypothetical protein
MTYSVTLEKQISLTDDEALQPTYVDAILTVTAVVGFNDKGIFTYLIDTVTSEQEYSNVATPYDIAEYNFEVVGGAQFVRNASVQKTFPTATQAEEFITEVEGLIQILCTDMDALDQFHPPVTVVISS